MQLTRITDPAEFTQSDLATLYHSYSGWEHRTGAELYVAFENSDIVRGFRDEDSGNLVSAGRALTDKVYYATIYDVIVDSEYWGQGLGTMIVNSLIEDRTLASVEVIQLDCREGLAPFYSEVGFERVESIPHEGEKTELCRMQLEP